MEDSTLNNLIDTLAFQLARGPEHAVETSTLKTVESSGVSFVELVLFSK